MSIQGADITAIPTFVAETLPLPAVGQIRIEGITGERVVPTFGAVLHLGNEYTTEPTEVILTDLDFVVLGRNVLNKFYLTLDGPEQEGTLRSVRDTSG